MDKSRRMPTVTSSPHVRSADHIRSVMLDVLIALAPAVLVGIFMFGPRAFVVTAITVGSCLLWEWLYCLVTHRPNPIGDLSAAVTGVLLACNLPVAVPLWLPVVGSFFAIVVVKQLYGGLGKNIFNPALAARVFLFLAWSTYMTTWTLPHTDLPWFANVADTVTSATPMATLKEGTTAGIDFVAMLLGQASGCIGETSKLAQLAGFVYLLARRVINPRIPVSYLLTVVIISLLFPQGGDTIQWMLAQLLCGGLIMAAVFMATDFTTSPATAGGQWIYGIGCGVVTMAIRYFGSYNEGVSFAILLMNAMVWMIDRVCRPRRYGVKPFAKLREKLANLLPKKSAEKGAEQK